MSKRIKVGKITYIHGAEPDQHAEPQIPGHPGEFVPSFLPPRVTLEELEAAERAVRGELAAGENDAPLGAPKAPAPSVAYMSTDFGTEEPVVVEGYVGLDAGEPHAKYLSDVDEYQIWGTDQNGSLPQRPARNWTAILVFTLFIVMVSMIIAGAAGIASTIRFAEFLQTVAPGSK